MMSRILLFVVILISLIACDAKMEKDPSNILLETGKTVEVSLERQNTTDRPKTFIADILSDQKIVNEKDLETDVFDIWANLEMIANQEEFEEAIIKYRYPVDDQNEKGEIQQIFVVSVFSAEKKENGEWKIDKIN